MDDIRSRIYTSLHPTVLLVLVHLTICTLLNDWTASLLLILLIPIHPIVIHPAHASFRSPCRPVSTSIKSDSVLSPCCDRFVLCTDMCCCCSSSFSLFLLLTHQQFANAHRASSYIHNLGALVCLYSHRLWFGEYLMWKIEFCVRSSLTEIDVDIYPTATRYFCFSQIFCQTKFSSVVHSLQWFQTSWKRGADRCALEWSLTIGYLNPCQTEDT